MASFSLWRLTECGKLNSTVDFLNMFFEMRIQIELTQSLVFRFWYWWWAIKWHNLYWSRGIQDCLLFSRFCEIFCFFFLNPFYRARFLIFREWIWRAVRAKMSSKVVYEGWMVRYGRRKIGRSFIHMRYFVLETRLLAYYKKKPQDNQVPKAMFALFLLSFTVPLWILNFFS